jgi:hypothetical protein
MPRFRLLGAESLDVKLPSVLETFQRETFGGETADGHEAGAMAKSAFQALPRFLVKFSGGSERILSQMQFLRFERGLQMRPDRIGFRSELLYPLAHHLRIANRA